MNSAIPDGRPVAIDLFCGCGGMTVGLKRAGFRVAVGVDIDTPALSSYQRNHPDVALVNADIRSVSGRSILANARMKKGELALLAGCPPCQGFSRMRRLNRARASRDSRNSLLLEYVRLVDELRPQMFLLENVPGLAKYYQFQDAVSTLASLGYTTAVTILDAADYGVPQHRKRLLLVGAKDFAPRIAGPSAKRRTVADAIRSLPPPGRSGDPIHDLRSKHSDLVRARIRSVPRNGGSRATAKAFAALSCHRRNLGFKDVYGRLGWQRLAGTITSGCINPSKGRFLHPTQNRALSLREAALLQGFPRKYSFDLAWGRGAVACQIGNAIPPDLITRHARLLRLDHGNI